MQAVERACRLHAVENGARWHQSRCACPGGLLLAPADVQRRAPVRTCLSCTHRVCTECSALYGGEGGFHVGRSCEQARAARAAHAGAEVARQERLADESVRQRARQIGFERQRRAHLANDIICPDCHSTYERVSGCAAMYCGRDYHGHDTLSRVRPTLGGCGRRLNFDEHRVPLPASVDATMREFVPLVEEVRAADAAPAGAAAYDEPPAGMVACRKCTLHGEPGRPCAACNDTLPPRPAVLPQAGAAPVREWYGGSALGITGDLAASVVLAPLAVLTVPMGLVCLATGGNPSNAVIAVSTPLWLIALPFFGAKALVDMVRT